MRRGPERAKCCVDGEAELRYEGADGKPAAVKRPMKKVLVWSRDYARKQRAERERLIRKAERYVRTEKGAARSELGDAAAFVRFEAADEGTGEVGKSRAKAVLDEEAIRKAERRDGLFLIVSSELDMKESEIVRAYSAQKSQERSFRVAKTYLKLRPVYLSREVRIKAHVLISYLSLLILRLLERKVLGSAYPVEMIVDEVRSYEAARIAPNSYFFLRYSDVLGALARKSGGNARLEVQTLSAIKKLFRGY